MKIKLKIISIILRGTYTIIYLYNISSALVAQSVEHWSYEPEVAGSIPAKRMLFWLILSPMYHVSFIFYLFTLHFIYPPPLLIIKKTTFFTQMNLILLKLGYYLNKNESSIQSNFDFKIIIFQKKNFELKIKN